jgi:hypothetical protein
MSYEMAGELPNGGFYQVRIGGPLPAKMLRHVEALVRMAAEWLEEDEAYVPSVGDHTDAG